MAAPGYGDAADVEALIAYISTELIPQRVAALAAARPRRILTRSGASTQSVGAGATVTMTGFSSAAGDGGGGSGITYNAGVLTVNASGWYQIGWSVSMNPSTSTGSLSGGIRVNGAGEILTDQAMRTVNPSTADISRFGVAYLNAADEIDLRVYNNAGASITTSAVDFMIEKIA